MYYDQRTGGHTYTVIVFEDCEGFVSYSPEYFAANSEHVTIVGDGEDFHSSDRVRASLEVGYWGTLDVESVS